MKKENKEEKVLSLEEYRTKQKEHKRNIMQIIVDGVEYFFLWLFRSANHKIIARLPGFQGFSRVPEKFQGPGRIPG